jgi:hypothetical protein
VVIPRPQATPIPLPFESAEEGADIVPSRVVVEDGEGQAVVPAVVDDAEDAEGAIVHLVDCQIAGELSQRLVEITARKHGPCFFPAASTPFWMVAWGTKARWSRPRCQLAAWSGRPSSATRRTASR